MTLDVDFPPILRLEADDTTAFLRAARSGNLERVIEYLDTDIDINTANSNGLNALHLASKDGHVEIVTELLKRGAKVDAATKKGNTALHIASLAGQTEIVNILIQYGAAVNIQSQNGFTPLYMAAQENHDHVVKLLLHNGANQSLATEDGFTPLAVAMQQGHDKVVSVLLENDSKGKVRLPALHIAARKDDCKAAELLLQNDHKPDVTSKSGFTPLHIAAHYGNEDIARLLIKRGADVNYLAKHNISPLHVAAKWGKNNLVKILLENSAIIDAKTRDGLTPLHCAARSGHEQVITTLLEHSAPISARTKNGLAPLHMASQGDHVGAARVLLYHRAPVDEVTIDYLTSLHVAAHCGHVRVAKLLIDRKADPNARALNGFTPLHIACKKNRIKVVELLLKHGASIESTTESGLTPLHVASFMGCMNIVIFLLQHEANPDVPTVRGETPLHLAARANQTDIIRILLRNGAKVDARARELQTPLHIAARLGNVDIVSLLLQHGAAVDTATKDMYTALHVASKEGQEEVAAILLDNNASINATTTNGLTPLHFAAKYGNMNVAKLLLQKDSKLDAQDKYGITPLHLACHYNHPNVAQLLLDKGASPRIKSQNCHTPLHIVARKNQMDIATTLLEHGANPNEQSRAGFTPLHLSAQRGHYDMTNLLIEHGADPNKQATNGLTALHLCAQEDFTKVASVLVNNGANIGSKTVTDFRPIHVAAHFGNLSMVKFLLKQNAEVDVKTSQNYTPLHQAAQQGHAHVVSALIEANAWHRARTNDGLTALNIAQKLGYISVMEVLKGLSYDGITPDNKNWEEKYKVIAPEMLQETSLMSDSEDEGGSEALISEQPYQYLTLDLMKSLQDDSLPIDVTGDDPTHKQQLLKQKKHEFIQSNNYCYAENFDSHDSSNTGLQIKPFLVSFLVDARGGTMKGCRHSGIRILVPPGRASMPIRVTCKLVKPSKLLNPPPQMDGEALATRIVEMGPVGVSFLGPVLIDIPHSASVTGKEREIIILKSENGESWKEHDNSNDGDDALMNSSYDAQMSQAYAGRIVRIITKEFPQYFAVITRIRQEVHVIGAEGGILISSVAENCQAVFPPGALTKKIKVGLQAHVIPTELTSKLLGNCVAVSPVVTIEPRRRKFHKPITITMPVPQAANKGMINQYAGETPTLRLLYSIAGGTSEAHWEDVTGSTPLTFMNDRISFTTTVSARFLLIDCRNIQDVSKMATELYRQSLFVPFVTNFIIYSKRVDIVEATLRILCMTDGKEGAPTLEKQEEFKEIVKSRDVDALDGKDLYIEFTGNLVPVTKSGSQLRFTFKAFRQNRLSFHVKVKDPQLDPVARMLFMREPKVAKGEPAQQPICVLNILLPEALCRQSKTEGTEDSNIISQKIDSLKTKRKEENEEKRDYPKSTSPSEKKLITDTLQKEHADVVNTLEQKAACSLESVEASYPKVSGREDVSPSIEHQTYSEKRKFWEDIARKRDSYQRSESEFSRTSQLTYNESDSDYLQNVISEDETEAMSGEIKSEIAEDINVPDISECTVAEKAHYFEEQIQKELSTISQLPKKPSISEGMSKTISQESELSLVSDRSKAEEKKVLLVEKKPIVEEPAKEKTKEVVKGKELKTEKESLKKDEKKAEKESKKGDVRKGIEQALKDVKKSIFSSKKDKQPGKSEKKKEQEMKVKEKEKEKEKESKKVDEKKKVALKDEGKKESKKEDLKKSKVVENTMQKVQLVSKKVVEEKKIVDVKKEKIVEKVVEEKKVEDVKKEEKVEKGVEERKSEDIKKEEKAEKVAEESKIKEDLKKGETIEKTLEKAMVEEIIPKTKQMEEVKIIIGVSSAQSSFEKEEERLAQAFTEKTEILEEKLAKEEEKAKVAKAQAGIEPTKSPVPAKDEETELEALKTQAEKEIEKIFTTKIEEKRLSQSKIDVDIQLEKPDAKPPKKESRIPLSASMAEKDKKEKKDEDKHEPKPKAEIKPEFESKIPKRMADKPGKSDVKKEDKSHKVLEQVSRERFGFSPDLPRVRKVSEGKVENVISKVDTTELMTHETKEVKSSQIIKGADKTLLHEEREHVAKKETSISSVTKHSPDEIVMETEKQIKELDTVTTQRTAMNITDDRQIIDAQASGLSVQNKESQRTKLQEDKDKISFEEVGTSKVKAKTVDVSLKAEKDLLQSEDKIKPEDIFDDDKDLSGYVTEKSVQEDSHEESSESFSSKINLKARPQSLIPKKGLEWKDSSSVQSSIDEFVEEEQKLMMEESEAREVANNLLQSIETELQSKSMEELRKVHSQDALDVDKSEDSLDDKLADKLTEKFESMIQKESEVPRVMQPIIETDLRTESASVSEEKDDSVALSSAQLRLQDRDITISPSSISELVELEADLTANDIEGASRSLRSELASDRMTQQVSSQSYYPETDQDRYEPKGIPKEFSEISGAKVLEILEPDMRSRQDSMDVPSLEIDDIKLIERVSQDFGMSRSQDPKDSSHSSFHESATVDALERMHVDRDITISPSTVSEDTNLDYSLTREQRESISSRSKKGDSFEIESPPLISPRLKVRELEIKPVDWMIGDEKIEIKETLEPSQAFDKELDEYQFKLSLDEDKVEEPKTELATSRSKFTVVPVNEQDLEKELIEDRLDVSCQELVATLQREHEAKTPTKEDGLADFIRLGDDLVTQSEEEKSDSAPDSFDAAIQESEKVDKVEASKVEVEKVEMKVKKDESQSPRMKKKVGQSDVSAFKLTTENLQNVDLSAKYVITVLDQVVKKEIAEVKESLEAAKQDLIEELSENSETVLQIKDSPSEFQFTLQPEPIPNELPFLYRAPSSEHEDRDSVASGSPVTKPRKQDSKDVSETDETLKVKLVGETEAEIEALESEPRITVCEESRDEESPLPGSRSGSDPDKEDNLSLLAPQAVPRRKPRPPKVKKNTDSEVDVSSSGESSQYQSCEYESGSRPSSSDIEALQSNQPSGTYSEYETALMSLDNSSDTRGTSADYQTAVSSLSSRESMKSLNSLSSGHLGSIDSTSELSETLVASDAEEDRDDLDFNPDFNLEDDEVGDLKTKTEDEGSYELNEEVPYRMKRSSEMIFQHMSEDTTLEDQEVSEDMESYEFKSTLPSSVVMDQTRKSKIPQRIVDAKPDRYPEETSEYFSATYTKSGRQSPTLISTTYDLRRPLNIEDETFDSAMTSSTLLQQASMSTSSASGISADTIVDREQDRHSPDSDSFELVDKPDIIDDFVVIEEVGKEAEEFDAEGKSIRIDTRSYATKKTYDRELEKLLTETRKEEEALKETQSAPKPGNNELFELETEESPPQASNEDQYSQSLSDEEQYDGNKKWIEMQFHSDARMYEVEYDRGPLEDIKEEEVTDFEAGSSKFGSLGSHKESIGSVGSMKGSFGSTPDYETLTKKYFIKPDHDNVSLSSLQEFETLETAIAMENSAKKHSGSQDSSSGGNGSFPRRYLSKSGHGDDVSLSSLKDFEKLESACKEAHMIELKAREEQELLDHESPENRYKLEMARAKLESSSRAASVNPSTSGSDDYEKRVKEIEEIIRVAQANVEKLERQDDTQEDISQMEEIEKPTTSAVVEVKVGAEGNVMETSTDSLEGENANQKYNAMCRSSDSLELKTTLDYPSLSSDSLNNVRDAKESQLDSSERHNTSRRISSDSLELPDQEGYSHSQEIDHESNIPQSDRQLGENVHESSSQPKP